MSSMIYEWTKMEHNTEILTVSMPAVRIADSQTVHLKAEVQVPMKEAAVTSLVTPPSEARALPCNCTKSSIMEPTMLADAFPPA